MSCAYQYGVETTAQPAAMPKVSAPDEICSRSRYGVTKTSVVGEQVGDLLDAEEAVVELDVILEAEVEHGLLERQPVALAFAVRDVRMRPSGDHVEHLGMALHDRRQRLDRRLEPLPGRDQPERREQEPLPVRAVRAARPARRRPATRRRRVRARRAARAPAARRAARPEPCPPGTCRRRRGGAARCRSSRSRARPGGRPPRAPRPDGASAPTAPCAASRRAAATAPRRARRRSRRRGRRRSRTRAGAGRRRRRAGRGSGRRARSRREPPGRSSP